MGGSGPVSPHNHFLRSPCQDRSKKTSEFDNNPAFPYALTTPQSRSAWPALIPVIVCGGALVRPTSPGAGGATAGHPGSGRSSEGLSSSTGRRSHIDNGRPVPYQLPVRIVITAIKKFSRINGLFLASGLALRIIVNHWGQRTFCEERKDRHSYMANWVLPGSRWPFAINDADCYSDRSHGTWRPGFGFEA